MDGENDIFTFIDVLCEALKQSFPTFDFSASEYLPLAEKDNFISMLASALVSNIEDISADFIVVMDDLHTITDDQVKKLIAYLIKYLPKDAKLCLGSREASWQDFVSFKVRGDITELTQRELAFTREEVTDILGFDAPYLYFSSEGWPLAIGSFKVLLENGVSIRDLPSYGQETLYAYLFQECIAHINPDMMDFLKKSACFDELDAQMLDYVLDKANQAHAGNLPSSNFSLNRGGFYRYHALFEAVCWNMRTKFRLLPATKTPGII